MTKSESIALYRILTVLAGWDDIIAEQEIEGDLDYLLSRIPPTRDPGAAPDFDEDDRDRMLAVLRAEIEANLYYADIDVGPLVEDVPDPQGLLS